VPRDTGAGRADSLDRDVFRMQRWMIPWLLPVVLLGAVALVSRPLFCVVWVSACLVVPRLVVGWIAYLAGNRGRTAPGTHDYLRKPS
jgi:hypothetical protein